MSNNIKFAEYRSSVQEIKQEKLRRGSFMNRFERALSARISWTLIRLFPSVVPNTISLLNVFLILFALSFSLDSAIGIKYIPAIQLVLFFISSVLDKVDGEIARYKRYFTQSGIYYDILYHFLYTFSFYTFLGFFFSHTTESGMWEMTAFLGILATFYKMFGKIRHHIRYKIALENNGAAIRDGIEHQRNHMSTLRYIDYIFYTPYEWTRLLLCLLYVSFLLFGPFVAHVYELFAALAGLFALYRLLIWYPRNSLYLKEDLDNSGQVSFYK